MTSAQLAAGLIALLALTAAAQAQVEHAVLRPSAILPPAEYDRPYKGELVTIKADNPEQMAKLCPRIPFAMGCAYPRAGGCLIVLIEDVHLIDRGINPEHVRRHEIGHCNGWPKDHRGARENR